MDRKAGGCGFGRLARAGWLVGLIVVALSGCSDGAKSGEAGQAHTVVASDLLGVWQRTDGDYILKIGSADPGGTLDAAYFNPRPINVGRAVWRMTGSVLKVEVVLDDVNYQGSSYTLVYDPGRQQLEGTYFQPAYGQTFEVFFVRRPAGGL